jgi:hypothetical protein
MTAAPRRLACALLLGLTAGCATQRVPGPMEPVVEPLPPGEEVGFAPGPQEVVVVRHADPVLLRRAGENVGRALAFYDRQVTVLSGTWVRCGAGGRAELLWPGQLGSLVVFGRGDVYLGEPSRDEVSASLQGVDRARLTLGPDQRVALAGGAELYAEGPLATGPIVVERRKLDVLRVANQSKRDVRIRFLDGELELRASEAIDLPVLAGGAAPRPADPTRLQVQGRSDGAEAFAAWLSGDLSLLADGGGDGLALRAVERSRVGALGVEIELAPGDEVRLALPGDLPALRPEEDETAEPSASRP